MSNDLQNEASVDGTEYKTLEEAITSANNNTITLLTNITREGDENSFTIPKVSTITIDLAGHSISGSISGNSSNYAELAVIKNEGNLTIKDDGNNGSISNVSNSAYSRLATIRNAEGATLTVEGGTINAKNGCAIANYGTCNIYSGLIQTTGGSDGGWINGTSCVDSRDSLTISSKNGLPEPEFRTSWKVPIYSGGTTTISCGIFSSTNWDSLIYVSDGETLVSGGTWVEYDPSEFLSDDCYVEKSDNNNYLVRTFTTSNITASTYENMASAYTNLVEHTSIHVTISGDIRLDDNLVIPFGSSLIISEGSKLIVPVNTSLEIEGRLAVEGTLSLENGYISNLDRISVSGSGKINGLALQSENGIYQVSTPADLQLLSSILYFTDENFEDKIIELTSDIDMSGYRFTPIGTLDNNFKGTFDGNGYKIKNLSIITGGSNAALFSYAECATFKNIYLKNCEFNTDSGEIGFIVAHCNIGGTFENIFVNEGCSTFNSNSYYSGGICGALDNQNINQNGKFYFINCSNNGGVTGRFNVGSMWGTSEKCISKIYLINCSNSGTISATGDSIGIAGGFVNVADTVYIYGFNNTGRVSNNGTNVTQYTMNDSNTVDSDMGLINEECVAYLKTSEGALTGYTTIQAAIDAASDGDTLNIFAGEYQEDLTITDLEKSFSIIGNDSTIKGLSLSIVSGKTVDISISAVKFTEKGLYINGANNVTVQNCHFNNITTRLGSPNLYEGSAIGIENTSGKIYIYKNEIVSVGNNTDAADNKKYMGICVTDPSGTNSTVEITENTITEVNQNAIYVQSPSPSAYASITISKNTIMNWDADDDGTSTDSENSPMGRAIRLDAILPADSTSLVLENIFVKEYKSFENGKLGYDSGNVMKVSGSDATFTENILALSGEFVNAEPFEFADDPDMKHHNSVIFNPNGGYFHDSSNPGFICTIISDDTVTITEPAIKPTKSSSTFDGWYDAATGGKEWDFDNSVISETTPLFAHWKSTSSGSGGVPIIPPATDKPIVKEEEVKNDDGTTSSITETTTKKENADGSKETTVKKDEVVKDESGKTQAVITETSKTTENKDGSKETVVEKKEEVKDESGKTQAVIEEKHSEVVSKDGSVNKTSETTVKDSSGKVVEEKTEVKIEDKNTGVSTSAEITKDSSGKTTSEIKTEASIETKNGKAEVDSKAVDAALKQAEAAKKTAEEKGVKDATPVIEINAEKSKEFTETQIAADDLSKLAEAEVDIKIKTAAGEVHLSPEVSKNLSSSADEKVLLAFGEADKEKLTEEQKKTVGDAPVFEFNLKSGDKDIHDLGGTAKITVPYELKKGEDANKITVWYLDEEGKPAAMNSAYDSETKSITFETSHFSYYFIAEDAAIQDDKKDDSSSNNTVYYAVAAVIIILIIIALAYYFMKKKQ